jgi:DNA topoisomerase-2
MEFITPIVKVTKGSKEICFYTIPEYENWKELNNDGKDWTIKYYKGLGTSTTQDAKKYFENLNRHAIGFEAVSDADRGLIDMAFSKSKIEERKEWLRQYQPGTFIDHNVKEISFSNFINKELILFSRADNERSIPNVIDGFKPGHRKILFSCFKRNLKNEIKVCVLKPCDIEIS